LCLLHPIVSVLFITWWYLIFLILELNYWNKSKSLYLVNLLLGFDMWGRFTLCF
jgi:hypothetical protein